MIGAIFQQITHSSQNCFCTCHWIVSHCKQFFFRKKKSATIVSHHRANVCHCPTLTSPLAVVWPAPSTRPNFCLHQSGGRGRRGSLAITFLEPVRGVHVDERRRSTIFCAAHLFFQLQLQRKDFCLVFLRLPDFAYLQASTRRDEPAHQKPKNEKQKLFNDALSLAPTTPVARRHRPQSRHCVCGHPRATTKSCWMALG